MEHVSVIEGFLKYGWWPVLAIAAAFAAREAYKAFLRRVESRAKEAAQRELAEHKADLDRHAELIKHDLARNLMQAELRAKSLHRIYPTLGRKFHEALGKANHAITPVDMGGPNYDRLTETELTAVVDQYRLTERDRQEVLEQIATKPTSIGQLFFKLERRKRFAEAFNARVEAHNYMLNKRLYVSDEVLALAQKIDQGLISPYVEAQMFYEYGPDRNRSKDQPNPLNKAIDEMNRLGQVLEQLDKQMRSELAPDL